MATVPVKTIIIIIIIRVWLLMMQVSEKHFTVA